MKEADRLARNTQRLGECWGPFAKRVRKVLDRLEGRGFRPRIQDGWRSQADQDRAFRDGFSKVRRSFHSVTGVGGLPEALAVDILDDDYPLNPRRSYLVALWQEAQAEDLETGLFWGLAKAQTDKLRQAISIQDWQTLNRLAIGWDPTHVECRGVSIPEAYKGIRPYV